MPEDLDDAPLAPRGPPSHLSGAQPGDGPREFGGRGPHQTYWSAARTVGIDLSHIGANFRRYRDAARRSRAGARGFRAARSGPARAWESFHKVLPLLVGCGFSIWRGSHPTGFTRGISRSRSPMKVGIAKEIGPGERRVAATPDSVRQIKTAGYDVHVEAGAGAGAFIPDVRFQEAGAGIVTNTADFWSRSEIVLKIQPPLPNRSLNLHEADLLAEGSTLICMLRPLSHIDTVRMLAKRRVTSFSMDMMPRTTRAQA